ncbi:PilZ domain-containing protein [Desulfobacterales bacterium HSG2]|nr:PilZ domain-containing protein [Desulfobacterales bacterium HSG2]
MPDKRRLKRKQLIYYLSVFDMDANKRIGQLVNITTEGLMLTSEKPIKVNSAFQLKMDLPEEIKGQKQITFDARSMWCRKGVNPDFYDIGFQLVNISQENSKIIERLIFDFSFYNT